MSPYRQFPQAKPAKRAPLDWRAGFLAFAIIALLAVAGPSLTGCKGPIFPEIQAVEQVVAADLEAGKTDAQIASDVCAALGGTSTTDAICGGVATLITDVVMVLLDTGVLSQKGQVNAHALLQRAAARGPGSGMFDGGER